MTLAEMAWYFEPTETEQTFSCKEGRYEWKTKR